jgi:glycerol-3-phosphate acyltransferase PlsY
MEVLAQHSGPGGPEAALGVGMLVLFGIVALVALAILVFVVICWWKIFSKAGYSGALALLMFVPFGELIMLCIMAFGKWPALKELQRLKELPGQLRQ